MREIETDTEVHGKTCVKFVPKTSKHHDFISIVPVAGCHSPIGHHPGKGILTIGPGCERKALIMHELIHTLGFWHEQTRHDRDKYISINITNVVADQQENFDLRNTQESTTYGIEYNFGSIMHYGPYAFAIDKSIPTIIPKVVLNGIMGQRLGLAKSDVAMIQNYYNCGSDLSHIATLDLKTLVDCDFEHGITSGKCILKQLNDDQFDWTLKSGATGISGSGPTADYTTGAGNYLLADARHHHNQTTRIQTIQLPRGVNCIQFFYFVYGSQVKSFAIKAKASGMDDHVIRQWDGSQLNEWKIQRLNMDSPVPWFLVIEAEIGNGDQSMVAIDELKIYHGHCILY